MLVDRFEEPIGYYINSISSNIVVYCQLYWLLVLILVYRVISIKVINSFTIISIIQVISYIVAYNEYTLFDSSTNNILTNTNIIIVIDSIYNRVTKAQPVVVLV